MPGRAGYEANAAIQHRFGNGGESPPIVAVVTMPVAASSMEQQLGAVERKVARAVPGGTTFLVAYPVPKKFGQNPRALARVRAALRGVTVAGAPVRVTGYEALSSGGSKKGGLGILAESIVGAVGALAVLAFVFASLLAFVPLVVAAISIMGTVLLVWALTAVTPVSGIVGFLIALVGLGVAVDYSLLIVVRWREERAHGYDGEEAVVRAMATAGRAVLFSGTTVAIGLLALVAIPVPFLRSVGYGGLLIPLVSVAVALTLLPVVLLKLGGRLDWPHLRTDNRASRAWTRWGALVVRRRGLAAAAACVLLGALLFAATSLHLGAPDGNPDVLAQTGDAHAGLVALERSGIGKGALSPIEIASPAAQAPQLVQRLGSVPGVHGAVAPAGGEWLRGGTRLVDVFPGATQAPPSPPSAIRRRPSPRTPASAGSSRRTTTSSTRSTATSRSSSGSSRCSRSSCSRGRSGRCSCR